MNNAVKYLENNSYSLVEEHQLDMFENSDNLNYPRRTKRSISGNKYELASPSEATSKKMKKISSKNTSIEILFEKALIHAKLLFCKPEQLIETIEGKPDFILPKYRFLDGKN